MKKVTLGDKEERLCEIAFIFGQLAAKKRIKFDVKDMEEAFIHYKKIYEEWESGMALNLEEEAYITAYANRVIIERYAK